VIVKDNLLIEFGILVRTERLKNRLSKEKLAERDGLHRTYIGMIERGEKNIMLINIHKIAKALNVSVSKLTKSL
jgi:transcriptional regulator with XRE-family HTH domain